MLPRCWLPSTVHRSPFTQLSLIPFTPEQFFAVFARYNREIWPMQFVLLALAVLCVVFLLSRREWASRQVAKLLAALWAWMAVVYHFQHFAKINPAAWAFGALCLLGAAAFVWYGVVKKTLVFRPEGGVRGAAGWVLIAFGLLVYPALNYAFGHRYPAMPTFGLPCPTTIFTLGMLLFAAAPVPKLAWVVPLAWAAVGSVAAFQLGVVEDLALLAAGVIVVGFALKASPQSREGR